jgi:hypothetical protein
MRNNKQDTEPIEIVRKKPARPINRIMDKPNPMLRDKPRLKLAKEISPEEVKRIQKEKLRRRLKIIFPLIFFLVMALIGNYILLTYRFHSSVRTGSIYIHSSPEASSYEVFGGGIVRFNREGVMFLNQRNTEQWMQPSQFNNPVFTASDQAFTISDRGGNGVQVFNRQGLIGEFETSFPIERTSVSNQGIVSIILRNDNTPLIMTFDAVGNILVEKQVPLATMGYPIALALSRDGMALVVSYLSIDGGRISSRVVHYNFANVSTASPDFVVSTQEFEDMIIPELFFTKDDFSVAITESSFVIFEGTQAPSITEHIFIEEEIVGVFYTNEYIGYLLLNQERVGYELRLHNIYGEVVMSREFTGEYSNIRMIDDNIIMFDGFGMCIISRQGVIRFQGSLEVNPLLVKPAFGVNRFHVMSDSDLRTVTLVR